MTEELHSWSWWFDQMPEFRGLKRPMNSESAAHRGIAGYESAIFSVEMLSGPDHVPFEIAIRNARMRAQARYPGLTTGVEREIIAARSMAAQASIWVPFILNEYH